MKYRILHATLSIALIIGSFFFGSIFEKEYRKQEDMKTQETTNRVDLIYSGKILEVQKADENLQIYLNGTLIKK